MIVILLYYYIIQILGFFLIKTIPFFLFNNKNKLSNIFLNDFFNLINLKLLNA